MVGVRLLVAVVAVGGVGAAPQLTSEQFHQQARSLPGFRSP